MSGSTFLPSSIYILTDVPMGPYYHYCSQLANGLLHCPPTSVTMISIFSDTSRKIQKSEEMAFLDERVAIKVLDPGKYGRLYRLVLLFFRLIGLAWQIFCSKNCVVHIHAPSGMLLFDAGLIILLKLSGARVVRTIHELTAAERFRAPSKMQMFFAGLQLHLVHHIIAHDLKTATRLHEEFHIDKSKITVVPHGNYLIFRKFASPEDLTASRPFEEKPIVLFQGIKRHKGIEVFLDAIRLLYQRGSHFKTLITGQVNPGDEDILETIKNIPGIELDSRYIPSSDMWRIYDRVAMVIMPYLKGTTSGAVHLAFAFSRPVISSDISCFDNLIIDRKTGLVTPAGDAESLANAIQYLLENPDEAVRLGKQGFELTSSPEYDWKRIAQVTVETYMK